MDVSVPNPCGPAPKSLTRLPSCRSKDLAALLPYRWQPRIDAQAEQPFADQLSAA